MKMEMKLIDLLIELQQKNPNIYIGGSISLILQNAIPPREPSDVDLITPNRIHIYDVFGVMDKERHRIIRQYRSSDGIKFELFYNPQAEYVSYIYYGHTLKLSPVEEVLEWKRKKLNKNMWEDNHHACVKHKQDLKLI